MKAMSKQLLHRVSRLASRIMPCAALGLLLCLGFAALGDKVQPTRLDVNAQPEGAQVFVDGKLRGAAPCQIFDLTFKRRTPSRRRKDSSSSRPPRLAPT